MRIVWDELKRTANLQKHSLDFGDLSLEFFLRARLAEARGGRFQALGILRERIAVVFKRLGAEAFAIVSLRPANATEREFL